MNHHPQYRPRPFLYDEPYMYPPRPYPPSLPPISGPPHGPPHPFYGNAGKKPKPPGVSGIMTGFTNETGQLDVQKTMTTIDTAVKTYQQVSPVVKQLSSFFLPRD
ncbi:hypothetical protein EPH95_02115 [Salicibibacter halophilus]|uniref:Spore coat protein n=1 Tax=Salicibibacter halophilus TaxID=2502791 RepID=A0A514LE48_9BACI|nr:YppG family protein [Salicibibacter halophilus]QDI90117.1 hypothetical protein EPH95_02115 [Salicibibacter halophilus]